jgi:ribosomal protein L15
LLRELLINKVWKSSVNLDKLWTLVPDEVREKYLNKQNETAPVIDTLALVYILPLFQSNCSQGYTKVLGKGRLPNTPIIVKARYVSRKAEIKIKEAGGVVELVA